MNTILDCILDQKGEGPQSQKAPVLAEEQRIWVSSVSL